MSILLGIDIGGTKIAGGLVDGQTGQLLYSDRIATNASEGGATVLARALALGKQILAEGNKRGLPAPSGIGVGAGGQIDAATGVVQSATEILPGWAGTRLAPAFAEAFNLPTVADNDVNALAAGENRFGAGRGMENLVYLALGTGVGGAIISGGRLHRSARGVSGELGHLVLQPDGHPCSCGGKGCLEQYVSGPALLRLYHALSGRQRPPTDANEPPPPFAAMAQSDPEGAAARTLKLAGSALGVGLVSLANIFGPERIIIGGGLAALGDLLLEPARQILAHRALPAVRDVPVVTAALGAEASVVGAASLVLLTEKP